MAAEMHIRENGDEPRTNYFSAEHSNPMELDTTATACELQPGWDTEPEK